MFPSDIAFLLAPLTLGIGIPAIFSASGGYRPICGGATKVPSLQPPPWAFGVAWTTLYALYGVAVFLAWRASGRRMTPALWASVALLAGLVMWPVIFFKLICSPELAFAAILALLGLACAVSLLFMRSKLIYSAWLYIPLVSWLCFASFLAFNSI